MLRRWHISSHRVNLIHSAIGDRFLRLLESWRCSTGLVKEQRMSGNPPTRAQTNTHTHTLTHTRESSAGIIQHPRTIVDAHQPKDKFSCCCCCCSCCCFWLQIVDLVYRDAIVWRCYHQMTFLATSSPLCLSVCLSLSLFLHSTELFFAPFSLSPESVIWDEHSDSSL